MSRSPVFRINDQYIQVAIRSVHSSSNKISTCNWLLGFVDFKRCLQLCYVLVLSLLLISLKLFPSFPHCGHLLEIFLCLVRHSLQ